MTTDYRALCAELLNAMDTLYKQSVTTPYSQTIEIDGIRHAIPIGKDILAQDAVYADLIDRARTALAQPEPVGPTDEELDSVFHEHCWTEDDLMGHDDFVKAARAVLARWGRPAIEPVPVSERFDFSVLDSEYEEQVVGTAPTYSQALSEGQHYLAMYSQDGPHSLEIRRVEVLPHHAQAEPEGLTDKSTHKHRWPVHLSRRQREMEVQKLCSQAGIDGAQQQQLRRNARDGVPLQDIIELIDFTVAMRQESTIAELTQPEPVGPTDKAFKPPRRLTLSEWADTYAFLSVESSAEGGRWHTLPYQKDIMDAISDPQIEQVSLMKSARESRNFRARTQAKRADSGKSGGSRG